ncbi:transposase-like protein [Nocardia kruczakiae]|uniref:Transposase-like protein n=1 Tax=Nocardia kruczakiae TaxID=261477 RepID=A0ABU1XH54_9NOCA|nr:transposase-like protein [Nocardia kruczakiae]
MDPTTRTPSYEGSTQAACSSEVRNRGVKDVLFLVCDGLKGLPAVVGNVWPRGQCAFAITFADRWPDARTY